MPSASSALAAFSIVSQSDFDPMRMPTSGGAEPGVMAAHSSKAPWRRTAGPWRATTRTPWHARCKLFVPNDARRGSAPAGPAAVVSHKYLIKKDNIDIDLRVGVAAGPPEGGR